MVILLGSHTIKEVYQRKARHGPGEISSINNTGRPLPALRARVSASLVDSENDVSYLIAMWFLLPSPFDKSQGSVRRWKTATISSCQLNASFHKSLTTAPLLNWIREFNRRMVPRNCSNVHNRPERRTTAESAKMLPQELSFYLDRNNLRAMIYRAAICRPYPGRLAVCWSHLLDADSSNIRTGPQIVNRSIWKKILNLGNKRPRGNVSYLHK